MRRGLQARLPARETATPLRLGEFELIAKYFRPLTRGEPNTFALSDDAAFIEPAPDSAIIATTDTIIAGVHFFETDPPDLVARKLLRVNLSDIAAMGAKPTTYLLAAAFPENVEEEWIAAFVDGLDKDQREFGIYLSGGDTAATTGPAVFTVTAFGDVPKDAALLRSGARPGDTIFVSGSIGDAALGLLVARGELSLDPKNAEFLLSRYRLPQPRISLGIQLRGIANAAIDVSDGLVADLGHICETSGVAAQLEWPRVPLSTAAREALKSHPALRDAILGGGDDYELLFTAPENAESRVMAAAKAAKVTVTAVGGIMAGSGISIRGDAGQKIEIPSGGYRHFRGR
jgi:thiamine-monophosphate kinase